MSCLIAGHLMNGIMDCIKVSCLCTFCKIKLTGGSAIFSINRLAVPRDEAKARSHIDYTHTLDDLLRCIRAAEQFKR